MKTEPLLPEPAIPAAPTAQRSIDAILNRLALGGYRIDREKWLRYVRAGLVRTPADGVDDERRTIARLRRILDVERRLSPSGDLDALCYYLAVGGISNVPPSAVGRYITRAIDALFALGDHVSFAVRKKGNTIGPDGEWRVGRAMARHVLAAYRPTSRTQSLTLELLLGAAFVGYGRSTHENPRPQRTLRSPSRLVNLDAEEEGLRRRGDGTPLPPLVDRDRIKTWITAQVDAFPPAIMSAAQRSAALIRVHTDIYPELFTPWRDGADACGHRGMPVMQALCIVPPVLAAAYLQAPDGMLSRPLETALVRLMHLWGTIDIASIRFELSTGAFPWLPRSAR